MHERNPHRMEEISFQRRSRLASNFFLAWGSVNRIADHRAAQRGKMHADLVRSTGVQTRFDKRKAAKPQPHSPVCTRLAAFSTSRRHPRSQPEIPCNAQLNSSRFAFQL